MKKKFLLSVLTVLLMIAVLFTLTACGDNDGESDDKDDKKESSSKQAQVINDYFEYLGDCKFDKAFDLIDWPAYLMITEEDYEYDEVEDEYDNFCDEYKDELKMMESVVESTAEYSDDYKDFEEFSIDVKDVGEAKKVSGTKDIYKLDAEVKTTVQETEDDDKETETYDLTIYVMKKNGDYYIVDGIDEIMQDL